MRTNINCKFLLVILFFLFNCNNSSDRTFEDFFLKFRTDENYQIQRIKYPLEYWAYENDLIEENEGLSKFIVTKKDWEFNDFTFNNQATFNIVNDDNFVVVEIRGIDSGIYIDYFFKKENNKWFLVKVENKSA